MSSSSGASGRSDGGRGELGRLGEGIAAERLSLRGYRVIDRNFRTREGEVDLVAWDGPTLAFIEVKTRRGRGYGLPEESITPTKSDRLVAAAWAYMGSMESPPEDWRIDAVLIEFGVGNAVRRFEVIKSAVEG
ncbi:MAG: YraN family protein [Chloroflexi bacterium]|nr:YraN family protein [Chloroflexota bacterium]